MHKNSLLAPEIPLDLPQFIERTEGPMTDESMMLDLSEIIPGDWGKVVSGWLAQPLFKVDRSGSPVEAGFTSSSGGVRASSVTRKWN